MTPRWEAVLAADVRPGDRVAPLSTWTLDVVAVDRRDGAWIAKNHDTHRIERYPHPEQFTNLHRLVR